MCCIFVHPNNGMAAHASDFEHAHSCKMHTIAHGGCTNTTKGLASKADCGIKNPCCTRESGAIQIPQKGLH